MRCLSHKIEIHGNEQQQLYSELDQVEVMPDNGTTRQGNRPLPNTPALAVNTLGYVERGTEIIPSMIPATVEQRAVVLRPLRYLPSRRI